MVDNFIYSFIWRQSLAASALAATAFARISPLSKPLPGQRCSRGLIRFGFWGNDNSNVQSVSDGEQGGRAGKSETRRKNMLLSGTRLEMIARAAELIRDHIHELLLTKERLVLAVPGGRNVAEIFARLRDSEMPWHRLDIFMLDERLVTIDHQESNYRQAHEILGAVMAEGTLHPFSFPPGNPAAGLEAYNRCLQASGGRFDIVLASSGEDGHIASLFPHHPSVNDRGGPFILVRNSPKPPSERISASAHCISEAGIGVLLFLGEDKRDALGAFQNRATDYLQCPAKIIGTIPVHYVLTDQEVEDR